MSGKTSGKISSPQNVQPKKKKRQVKSKEDNGENMYGFDGVSTYQLSTDLNMALQNQNGMPSMLGQFMPKQGPSSSMQGQLPAPMMYSSYSPPPKPPSQMNS